MRIGLNNKKNNYDWEHLLFEYKRLVKTDSLVLEIGCSVKDRTDELSKYCKKLIGVELMPERIPNEGSNIKYVVGDWQKLSEVIAPNSIDIAVASHVIEHVPNDEKAINELYKVLKPGGVALINTPNRKRLTRSLVEIFTGEKKFPNWEHVREYVYTDLENILKKTKFKKYKIIPLVFGLHGGRIFIYAENVHKKLKKYANYYEIQLYKD